MLTTELTRAWGLRVPLVSAPMAGVAGGALAGAVSAAGALGMLGVGSATPLDWIAAEADVARSHGPFGIGLMCWAIAQRPELFDAALAAHPFALSPPSATSHPTPPGRGRPAVRVIGMVQDTATAERAIAAGVDALVAQGTDAGPATRARWGRCRCSS